LRIVISRIATVLAFLLLWAALVSPNQLSQLTPGEFLRIPVEGLVVLTLALVLPPRARSVLAVAFGATLGLLVVLKVLDMGFFAALDRPFNPVSDWAYFGSALGVLRDSVGVRWAVVLAIGAVLLIVSLLLFVTLSVVRLTRVTARHRAVSGRTITVLGVAWILCAALGVQVAGAPVASTNAAGLAYHQLRDFSASIQDQQRFASALAADDPLGDTPASGLLTGLRGKDVIVAFVESYGRVAVQDSAISAPIDAELNAGTTTLRAAGFDSRSAFLTSPTFGGISWLAHSTLQSGLWINSQLRYNQVVSSDRFTLSDAFRRAGWRTVGDVPSNSVDWPEGSSFYHYDTIYDQRNLGYAGPKFSYAAMPDQYTMAAFQRTELSAEHRPPVMAEIDLVSSHTPWAPLPRMVDWPAVGDGSVFDGMPAEGASPQAVWRHSADVKTAYGLSIQYSLRTLISFVQTFHDSNLVLVLLGDHQPAAIVSGSGASHDVPITIIAHDPQVMSRISSWGWQDGMLPSPQAPVWAMDTFRGRFLSAYGPHPPSALAGVLASPH
jgi:hypothetical protein